MIILWAWLGVVVLMSMTWLYYRMKGNPGAIDVVWSIGHWLAGSLFLFNNSVNARTMVLWLLLTLWAGRLAGYLYWTRVRVGEVDKRYTEISEQWTMAPSLGFFLNFQLQGVLLMPIVLSLYFAGQSQSSTLNLLDWVGVLLVLCGITFETIADLQLKQFVKQNKGKVCNVGLWRYSRHPNYFFEWLVWVGFFCTAVSTPMGWLGIVSPLTIFVIMNYITGPITERGSLASRGQAYLDYQKTTSMFFPRPPKGG